MAFVSVPAINIGDEIKVDTLNTFISEIQAVPGNINEENVRDEGIDRRNLAASAIQQFEDTGVYIYRSSDDHEVTGSGTLFKTVQHSTNGHPIEVGTISCENGDFILISCSFSFRAGTNTGLASSQNQGGYEVHFRLVFDDLVAGIALQPMAGTERRFNNFMSMHTRLSSPKHAFTRYSCTIVAALQADTTTGGTTAGTNAIAVGLQARDRLSNNASLDGFAIVEEVQLFARVIRR